MKAKKIKAFMAAALAVCMVASMTGCGKSKVALNDGEFQEVDKVELEFPLKPGNHHCSGRLHRCLYAESESCF